MPKGRILAVDDQRYFRELLEGLLSEEGYDVVTASSGEEALRILEQSHFDILLTDLVMPGMDGNDLVHRAKQRDPEQEIVVVTGVVDVKTAVDAMKLGASEYLIKPFDRETLASALDKILQGRRLRVEHARLLAENIEYLGERSLIERAMTLFTCLAVDPLAARIVEGLCVETRAQGGIVWVVDEDRPERLNLAAVRGLVQVNEEPAVLHLEDLPGGLVDGSSTSVLRPWSGSGGEERPALHVALRRGEQITAVVRLTDKLGADEFDAVDQACSEKFVEFGQSALANALRFARLEQRSLADPDTGAFSLDYLHDVVRSEIEKSNRFGRSFSIVKIEVGAVDDVRRKLGKRGWEAGLGEVVVRLKAGMRAADVLATDGEGRFLLLLPETDALGGSVFKQRVQQSLEQQDPFAVEREADRPQIDFAAVSFPGDGTQLESLLRAVDERVEENRRSPVQVLGLAPLSLDESLAALLEIGEPERPEVVDSIVRFLVAEVARRPGESGLLLMSPGEALWPAMAAGLESLVGVLPRSEVLVVSDRPRPEKLPATAAWLSPPDGRPLAPFLVRYGTGAVYALLRDEKQDDEGARMYHTNDRSVVEHLAFQLQRELALPELA
jgi:two-component system cell cycle response regulator